jgi:hypothetical protein
MKTEEERRRKERRGMEKEVWHLECLCSENNVLKYATLDFKLRGSSKCS